MLLELDEEAADVGDVAQDFLGVFEGVVFVGE
jgi:hypothetical protein